MRDDKRRFPAHCPTNHSLGKLYSNLFYRLLAKRLAAHGAAVVQTTSPFHARQSFWCIVRTIESVGFAATPYHAYVPAFGEWGFTLATRQPWRPPDRYPPGLRFLTLEMTPTLFQFSPDMGPVEVEINRLNNQILVHYYLLWLRPFRAKVLSIHREGVGPPWQRKPI